MDDTDLRNVYEVLAESTQVDGANLLRVIDQSESEGRRLPPQRWLLAVAAACVLAIVGGVPVLLASGDGGSTKPAEDPTSLETDDAPTPEPEWPTREAHRYGNRLTRVADQDDRWVGFSSPGPGTHLTMYGVGEAPFPALQAVIDEAPPGIEVEWVEVPYTESQLEATIRIARAELPDVTSSSYNAFHYVSIGVCPKQPGQLPALQQMADQLGTPAPIRLKIEPPLWMGLGPMPDALKCAE